jgi:histidinol phosphatase-like enzyme
MRDVAPRPCAFFDRDGVINESPPKGEYVLHWNQFG